MNDFELFGFPIAFHLEQTELRSRYLELSKKYHPDFHSLEPEETQADAEAMTTRINEAYKKLSDPLSRMEYILKLKGLTAEERRSDIPAEFLMEMMDFNEQLLHLEVSFNLDDYQKLSASFAALESSLWQDVKPHLESFDNQDATRDSLHAILDFFLKQRYLNRLRTNLSKLMEDRS